MSKVRLYLRGLRLFVAFMVGRVPNRLVRHLAYKKLFGMRIGRGSTIHWRLVMFQPSGIRVGAHSVIGNDCFLDGREGILIGDSVNIGGHVQIFTREHDPQAPDFGTAGGPVVVGDMAYVASRATVLPGVTIGMGAVVACGAVVTRDVGAFEIVGGVPARPIGSRTRDVNYKLGFHLPFQ